jgi:hypothetical protein
MKWVHEGIGQIRGEMNVFSVLNLQNRMPILNLQSRMCNEWALQIRGITAGAKRFRKSMRLTLPSHWVARESGHSFHQTHEVSFHPFPSLDFQIKRIESCWTNHGYFILKSWCKFKEMICKFTHKIHSRSLWCISS